MLSKAKLKFIRSLGQKKGRMAEHAFVGEGPKVVRELLKTFEPRLILHTDNWLLHDEALPKDTETVVVSDDELRRASFLQHPQDVLAVFSMPEDDAAPIDDKELYLALDGVQDPGNLGTIIRIADWFGIKKIFCSRDTADVYNPKVVQATMGSLARVDVLYADLQNILEQLPQDFPIYGTLLDGNNIYKEELSANGIIVMGNEGNGISQNVRRLVSRKLLIPRFPEGSNTAESLNVAIATAITCAEFRRRKL